ncbi:MAG TPA: NAD(P)/FAD-dependent oxidoreductase [Candidatus Nanoarchaeia archaeon]|nr:NAD(P)/FAD-dependent oxidoreductase [Candidatus Nanoarchaeia archaeon]
MIKIIGAGPAGSYLGYLLAKSGKSVDIYEEHKEIGYPIQCAGIITSSIQKIINIPKEIILNEITQFNVIYKDKNIILKVKPNLVLDRAKFDQFLAKKAEEAGVKIHLNSKYISNDNKKIIINQEKIPFRYLIGADGPSSLVSKNNNFKKNKLIYGIQATIDGNFEIQTSNIYLNFGNFAWLIPISKTKARLGLISKTPKKDFDNLVKELKPKILEYQAGTIPIFKKKQLQKNNIFLLGDAAAQIKLTTYGGIIPGLEAAKELSEAIIKNKQYKPKNKELIVSRLLRNKLNKFTEKDYDLLFTYFNKKIKLILENNDRDYPSKILLKLIIAQPKLLRFLIS